MTSGEGKDTEKKSFSIPTWGIILIVVCIIFIIIAAVWKMFMQYKEVSLAATGLGDLTQLGNKYLDAKSADAAASAAAAHAALRHAYSR